MKRANTFFLTFVFGIISVLTAMLCACGGGGSDTPNTIIPQIPEVKRDITCELIASDGSWLWNKERSRATYEPKEDDLLLPNESTVPSGQINGWMQIGSSWVAVPFNYISGTHPNEYHYSGVAKDQSGTCNKIFIYDIPNTQTIDKNPITPSLSGTTFSLTGLSDITTLDDDIRVATKERNETDQKTGNGCFDFTINNKGKNRNSRSCLEHIYSCLQIGFRVGSKYTELRYIQIKSVNIKRHNETYTYTQNTSSYAEGTFSLTSGTSSQVDFSVPQVYINNKTDANYNQVITADPAPKAGLILGAGDRTYNNPSIDDYTQAKAINGTEKFLTWGRVLFAPNLYTSSGFTLEIIYDVYTLNGQKTRVNDKQEVKVKVTDFKIKQTDTYNTISAFAAGSYYNLLVDINPDYVYVIADDDITGYVPITTAK